jgi:hypothetical protein
LGLKAKGKRKVDRGVQEEGEGRRRRAEIVDSRERRRQKGPPKGFGTREISAEPKNIPYRTREISRRTKSRNQ